MILSSHENVSSSIDFHLAIQVEESRIWTEPIPGVDNQLNRLMEGHGSRRSHTRRDTISSDQIAFQILLSLAGNDSAEGEI